MKLILRQICIIEPIWLTKTLTKTSKIFIKGKDATVAVKEEEENNYLYCQIKSS